MSESPLNGALRSWKSQQECESAELSALGLALTHVVPVLFGPPDPQQDCCYLFVHTDYGIRMINLSWHRHVYRRGRGKRDLLQVSFHLMNRPSKSIYTRASKFELENDWNNAFKLYLQAADAFLHISRTADPKYRNNAAKALDRARKIQQHKNLNPLSIDHFSHRK